MIRPITDLQRDQVRTFIQDNPRLSQVLPTRLPDSTVMEALNLECANCSVTIRPGWAFARISTLEFASKTVQTFDIRGVCHECQTMTPFFFRFHSSGRFDTIFKGHWRYGTLNRKRSLAAGFRDLVRRLVSRHKR